MVRQVTATQAKAGLLSLLDEIEGGDTVDITRHGRLVARLVPARGAGALRGRLADMAMSDADDEELFSTGVAWDAER